MLDHIFKLAELGLRIHPLLERNKVPIVTKWTELATTDLTVIEKWSRVNVNCNWGVATGPDSKVFVVDIDPKNGGDVEWEKITSQQKPFTTWTVKTGSGGYHYYFEYPAKIVVRNRPIAKGVDTRGANGQVVAPPSIHPNGTPYTWVEGKSPWDVKLAKPPKWLIELLDATSESTEYPKPGEPIPAGTRNDAIYHNALSAARLGSTKDHAYASMILWCKEQRDTVDEHEIKTTVDSAYQAYEREVTKIKKAKLSFNKNDNDNANKLISDHGSDIMYVPQIGWYTWNNKYWRFDVDDASTSMKAIDSMQDLKNQALELMKITTDTTLYKELNVQQNWANLSMNNGKLESMVDLAKKKDAVRVDPMLLDPPESKWLLNCANGTLDMLTGKLKPHDRKDRMTKIVPCKYDPDATCPFWLQTLDLAFDGNTELISFMQRALGYTLSGSVSAQALFICWGESGKNGKSTILEGFSRMFGDDYTKTIDMKVLTSKEMDNHVASSLAGMRGTRMVNLNEADDRQRLNESLVKSITGGDKVEAFFKYKSPFEYMPTAKLWIRTNEKPVIRSMSEAMWRRIMLIPFNKQIPDNVRRSRDEVDDLIDHETPGILNWAINGFYQWRDAGFNLKPPTIVQEAVQEYRSEQDVIGQFFNESVVVETGATVSRNELYQTFTRWAQNNGYRSYITAEFFARRVTKFFNQPRERKKVGGDFVWLGIRMSEQAVINLQGY